MIQSLFTLILYLFFIIKNCLFNPSLTISCHLIFIQREQKVTLFIMNYNYIDQHNYNRHKNKHSVSLSQLTLKANTVFSICTSVENVHKLLMEEP